MLLIWCHVMCDVMWSDVMSCHAMRWHVMSCGVMLCDLMSCHVVRCHVICFISCHVVSCHVWCHVTLCHAMRCHVMWCGVMSCHVIYSTVFSVYFRFISKDMPSTSSVIHNSRRQIQLRITRVIIIQVVAFLISWSPYCAVSLAAMFKHSYVLKDGEAEIPALLAKSSVIYNPIIYTIFSKYFRGHLQTLLLTWLNKMLRGCSVTR